MARGVTAITAVTIRGVQRLHTVRAHVARASPVNPEMHHQSTPSRRAILASAATILLACGDSTGPQEATTIPFGQTTFVAVVNPVINAINTQAVAQPDTARRNFTVAVTGGPNDVTDTSGVAVLGPVAAGTRILTFARGSLTGELSARIDSSDLRELAVAVRPGSSALMAEIVYAFGGRVVEVTPSMPIVEVNQRLSESNVIVFLRGGTYTGNLTFSGSNVTLYGEGEQGGTVTIVGSVTVGGSGNRIRGARITQSLTVPGSGFGMSLSRVDGAFELSGSGGRLLQNVFCGSVATPGSNVTALGNAGMAPIARPAGCG